MSETVVPAPLVLDADALPTAAAEAVLDRALVAATDVTVLDVAGPGAVACLQGLLTSDVEKPGDGGHVYGALLTPKGMVVTDLWVWREAAGATLVIPADGAGSARDILARTLPPRLAKVTDRPGLTTLRVVGPDAERALGRAGITLPEPGRVHAAIAGSSVTVARPAHGIPFVAELLLAEEHAPAMMDRLADGGAVRGTAAALELARVLAGWPRVGAEIADKTLPQEVRFDEIGGVSYTKGCYTGQETVARVHFRGHPNRHLRGLIWDGIPDPAASEVFQDDTLRGRVGTVLWLEPVERWIGLALLRHEVATDRPVLAAGAEAAVVELPFRIDQ